MKAKIIIFFIIIIFIVLFSFPLKLKNNSYFSQISVFPLLCTVCFTGFPCFAQKSLSVQTQKPDGLGSKPQLLHLLPVTLGKLLSFSEPQSPHLLNGDNNSIFLIKFIHTYSFTLFPLFTHLFAMK